MPCVVGKIGGAIGNLVMLRRTAEKNIDLDHGERRALAAGVSPTSGKERRSPGATAAPTRLRGSPPPSAALGHPRAAGYSAPHKPRSSLGNILTSFATSP